jgi:acyl carrier protein
MNRKDIFNELNEVFQDVFEDKSITVNEETSSKDIEDWDSLEHINLVVSVEKKFDMKFSMEEVTNMKNVGAMVDIILERVK